MSVEQEELDEFLKNLGKEDITQKNANKLLKQLIVCSEAQLSKKNIKPTLIA